MLQALEGGMLEERIQLMELANFYSRKAKRLLLKKRWTAAKKQSTAAKKYFLAHNLHRTGLRRSRSACWTRHLAEDITHPARERWRGGTAS